MVWKIANGLQKHRGALEANAAGCGKWSEDADCPDTGAARHLNILWGVADVDAILRVCVEAVESEQERGGMWFLLGSILAADAHRKIIGELKLAQLAPHALAASAGDDCETEIPPEGFQDASRSRQQDGTFFAIGPAP